ncbi:hypothetical protein CEXT_140221 [Caerostris extrusa]|uniref:Uncharacterized protein n=1 Tax=Caerostris extrusa TaxID=172846 RepID=A0AAV4XQR2_CAEEX|nr:hypothetical protein CEXT_140221 [Caerostris extrusa]
MFPDATNLFLSIMCGMHDPFVSEQRENRDITLGFSAKFRGVTHSVSISEASHLRVASWHTLCNWREEYFFQVFTYAFNMDAVRRPNNWASKIKEN